MTLKQIFPLENISCVHLHDILKRLLAKVCFNASFMCLSRFVAFCVTFNDSCCWTQRCVLLFRIRLKIMDQIWQTSPNEPVLHYEVVLVVCWHQIGKLVQVVYIIISILLSNYTNFPHQFVNWWYWNKSSNWKNLFYVYLHDELKRLLAKVCFDASFMCLSRFVAFRITFNDLCCWTQRCDLLSCIQ